MSCANPPRARVEGNERDESDPTTWSLADDDYELSDIVADYHAHRQARNDAALELDDWKSRHAIASTERDNRLERARQLEEQLARIHSDCEELQSKTAEIRHLIEEDHALARTYRTSE
jgi:chromosome segregation ATPase